MATIIDSSVINGVLHNGVTYKNIYITYDLVAIAVKFDNNVVRACLSRRINIGALNKNAMVLAKTIAHAYAGEI